MEDLNMLVVYAKNPKKYNKNAKECLIDFFIKTNVNDHNPDLYSKNIVDYYEKELYKVLYEDEVSLQLVPYNFEEAYFLYAAEMIKENNLKEAISNLEKAISWNPVNRKAIFLICKLHFSLRNFNKAYEFALRGLKLEFNKEHIIYYYSVLTVYYLKNKESVKADECAINLFLLDNTDTPTIKYLENRNIYEIIPNATKSELIMDSLLNVIYDKDIIKAERARYAKILVGYETLPIFKYDNFYLVLESGVKDSEIKESVIVGGKYLISEIAGNNYYDIKDRKAKFEKLVMDYFDRLNEFNLRFDKYNNEREKYENEIFIEEIKIKFNGKFYFVANVQDEDIAKLYLEMKKDILEVANEITAGVESIDSILEVYNA